MHRLLPPLISAVLLLISLHSCQRVAAALSSGPSGHTLSSSLQVFGNVTLVDSAGTVQNLLDIIQRQEALLTQQSALISSLQSVASSYAQVSLLDSTAQPTNVFSWTAFLSSGSLTAASDGIRVTAAGSYLLGFSLSASVMPSGGWNVFAVLSPNQSGQRQVQIPTFAATATAVIKLTAAQVPATMQLYSLATPAGTTFYVGTNLWMRQIG